MRANYLEIRFPLPVLQILLSKPFDRHRLVREMLRFMVRADVTHQTRGEETQSKEAYPASRYLQTARRRESFATALSKAL